METEMIDAVYAVAVRGFGALPVLLVMAYFFLKALPKIGLLIEDEITGTESFRRIRREAADFWEKNFGRKPAAKVVIAEVMPDLPAQPAPLP
jgi:hypothetical protein